MWISSGGSLFSLPHYVSTALAKLQNLYRGSEVLCDLAPTRLSDPQTPSCSICPLSQRTPLSAFRFSRKHVPAKGPWLLQSLLLGKLLPLASSDG